jgi:hypothetical protein
MRYLSTLRTGILTLVVGILFTGSALAQTATTTTTLASAVTSVSANTVVVTSATNVEAGGALYVDRELLSVISVSGTTIRVARGSGGTAATTHGALAVVYVATTAQRGLVFNATDHAGSCTSTNEQYLPQVNPRTAAIWDCPSALGLWVNTRTAVTVTCRALLIADMVDQTCFNVDKAYAVSKITYTSKVVEAGGTLTIIPRRQQSTEAPASGDALATAVSGVSTVAETFTTFTLTTTPALLLLSSGERLALDFTDDTAGELAGVTVTFTLYPR